MTTRHGLPSTLRFARPQSKSASPRFFSGCVRLKEQDSRRAESGPLHEGVYEHAGPAQHDRNSSLFRGILQNDLTFLAKVSNRTRIFMRSTPHPVTVIVARPPPPSLQPQTLEEEVKKGHEKANQPTPNKPIFPEHWSPKITGLLVSSFNTVTLYPKPYVSFNIKIPSSTYSAILASEHFTATGLSNAEVAKDFSKRTFLPGDRRGEKVLYDMVGEGERLKEGKGGLWWMRCKFAKDKSVKVEDHVVVVGEVLDAEGYGDADEGMGLVYVRGRYRSVGKEVHVEGEGEGEGEDGR